MGGYMMARRRQSSSSIAKERLKLVLIHDRAKTSPSSSMLEMLRKDIMAVISKYFDVDEDAFDVEIKNSADVPSSQGSSTRLTANIPIRSVKSIGPNR
jgi:cell division topological specificity factor